MFKKIGIIHEGKVPVDRRVPLTPEHCALLQSTYPEVDLVVQKSDVRAFTDQEYTDAGIRVVDDLQDRELILGVKEVPINMLIEEKTYLFFSHTMKKQSYNKPLLRSILDKKITLLDLELLENEKGERVVAFGRWAGIVGSYNALRLWQRIHGHERLKPAHKCHDRVEMEGQLHDLENPRDLRIVITGTGRVAHGAEEILKRGGMRQVALEEFMHLDNTSPVFTMLHTEQMYEREDGKPFDLKAFYADPTGHRSIMGGIIKHAHIYIACHYWNPNGPVIVSQNDLSNARPKLRVVADISCDVGGPVACTVRSSTIDEPFYGYDPDTHKEVELGTKNSIAVMAVDNLPCELPRDASQAFGEDLMKHVIPAFAGHAPERIIKGAAIAEKGVLTPAFQYLAGWVNN